MSKKFYIIGALLALALAIFFFRHYAAGGKLAGGHDDPGLSREKRALLGDKYAFLEGRLKELGLDPAGGDEPLSVFDQDQLLDYQAIIDGAKTGKVNLVRELYKLRRRCPKEMPQQECSQKILQLILKRFPEPDNMHLADMYTAYLKYENMVRELKPDSSKSLSQLNEEMRELRGEIFKADDDALIFGYNDAKIRMMDAEEAFVAKTAELTGLEKLAEYEKTRKKILGNYYAEEVATEGVFVQYQREMEFRETELQQMPEDGRYAETRKAREKYFGKEAADRMDKVDQEHKAYLQMEQDYRVREADLLKKYPNISDSEKADKLRALQDEMFGKEEAEIFRAKEQERQYWEKQNP